MNPTLNQTIKRIITEVSSDVNNEELVDLTCAGGNINPISSPPPNNAKVAGIVHLWSHPCGPWLYPYSLGSTPTGSKVYVSEQTDLIAGLTPTSPIEQRSQAYYDQVVSQSGPISAGDVLHLSESACWGAAPHSCIRYEGTTNSGTNSSLLFQGVAYHGGPFGSCGDCGVDIPATNHGCQDPNALNTQPHPNYNGPTGTYNGTWGTPPSQGNCQGSWSQQTYYLPLYQNTGGIMTTTGNNPNNAGNPSPQPWCIPKFIHASHVSCCNYNAGCIDNGMFSNSPTPGVPASNYDPNANSDCNGKPCSAVEAEVTGYGWLSNHSCCTYDAVVDKEGCDDPTALNYGICCDGDPNCTPTISNPKCCRYEGGDEDRGCMDPNALNYNKCCDTTDPNCVPNIDTKDCCKYDVEPSIHVWDLGTCCQPGQACGLWYPMLGSSLGISFVVTNPVYQQANNDLWLALGSPAVGDFNRIYAQGTCVEYIGLIPLNTYPIWNASSVNNTFLNSWPLDTNLYNDCKCEDGRGGTEDKGCMDPNALNNGECCNGDPNCTAIYPNPECCRYEDNPVDEIYCECCDKFGDNISMVQTVSSPADCIGAENTVYSGMGVYGCNVSPVSGGPGTKCKKPIPTNDFPVELSEEIKRIKELL